MLFLDPPYASDLAEVTLTALVERRILAAHGVLIWQHMACRAVPPMGLELPLWKSRRYGNTQLSLYAALPIPSAMEGDEGQETPRTLEERERG
jgi:16S rRNA G966 N2-methylase RsmD